MENVKALWVDDEIDLLKSQIFFLKQKGVNVQPATNGEDALEAVAAEDFDIIFLDENMPGMNGLETLAEIKNQKPLTPVVMITKSEEEHVMESAIGSKIADYLIKPVNPNQVLLSVKKILSGKKLVSQKVNADYQRDFTRIGMAFFDDMSPEEWAEIYKKLVFWELELENSVDKSMVEVFQQQKQEANVNFCKFVSKNYIDWVNSPSNERPLLSPDVMKAKVFPLIKKNEHSVFFFLIDCLRFDQWKMFEPILSQYFTVQTEETYISILPTATQYARNAIFSGFMPDQIAEKFPKLWVNDDEEGGKNMHEEELLVAQLKRENLNIKHSYTKIVANEEARQFTDNILNYLHNDLNVVVVNFIDLLTHARSEMNIVKELAPDEAAFRSLSRSWLEHSALLEMFQKLRDQKVKVVFTTDHGSIRVNRPVKIIGDRNTTTNLRYKQGRNLNYDEKSRLVFSVKKPSDTRLPKTTVSGTYAFACEDSFFVYPNNYNYYAGYYKDTFQHGGVSMEEMIVPLICLEPKG